MQITQGFIDSFAPGPATLESGMKLVRDGRYLTLNKTADGALYFGDCVGSGARPYRCSVDFSGDQAVGRCSCPSRQLPCKHCVGLLQAVLLGKRFALADVPEDIAEKRAKAEIRAEKKAEKPPAPKPTEPGSMTNAQRSALKKKAEAQRTGIGVAAQMLGDLVKSGLGAIDVRARRAFEAQVKALGNYYIPGVQAAFSALLLALEDSGEDRMVRAVDRATYLHALLRRGADYLERKRDDPEPDVSTNIEELLGRAWKLDELRRYGCCVRDARLVQLCFSSFDDESGTQTVEEGIWYCLGDARLYKTRNYRPYRAAKYIKAEDTVSEAVLTPELFVYPGGLNPRVRWEQSVSAQPEPADYAAMRAAAEPDFEAAIKTVKNQLRDPLADKSPLALVRFAEICSAGERGTEIVLRDRAGAQIMLRDTRYSKRPVLPLLRCALAGARDEVMLLCFENDLADGVLAARPLCAVTERGLLRLLY